MLKKEGDVEFEISVQTIISIKSYLDVRIVNLVFVLSNNKRKYYKYS